MKYEKTIILPILAVIAMVIEVSFGVKIPADLLNQVAFTLGNAVALGLSIYGIFKSHHKK